MTNTARHGSESLEGWVQTNLGTVVSPSKAKVEPSERADSPYLSLEHIESNTGLIIGRGTGAEVNSTKAVFRSGDVLYGKLRPYLNKVCIPDFDGICSTDILVFAKMEHLEPRYLMRFLMQQGVVEYAHHHSAGVQLPRVSFGKLAELDFPLPPLAEQKRIVAKVEELLARVNVARERLAKVPGILKRFRQSVLAAACSGRLTEEWRDESPEIESADRLLRRIRADRRESAKQGRRLRDGDQDEDVTSEVLATTWEIPESWCWVPTREVLHYSRSAAYGVLQPGDDIAAGVPFVRVCDIGNGTIDSTDIKRIAPEIDRQYPRTRLQGNEVLVTLVGTIGRTAVVPPSMAGANVARAVGMLPLCPHVVPAFIRCALDQPNKNKELVDLAREVARKTLNLGLLKAVKLPLPPLAEQREIVRRVDALFALADKIEARVASATARVEKITQAILAKAFRGDLVPTEAELARQEGRDYEPASMLLERIRASQEEGEQAGQGERRRGRGEAGAAGRRAKAGQATRTRK